MMSLGVRSYRFIGGVPHNANDLNKYNGTYTIQHHFYFIMMGMRMCFNGVIIPGIYGICFLQN